MTSSPTSLLFLTLLLTTAFGSLASEFSSLERSVADLTFGKINLT